MKKTIYALGMAVLLLGSASCSSSNSYSEQDKLYGDSLSIAIGEVMGANIKTTVDRQKERNDGKSTLNIQRVMRGMETILYADTADDNSYLQGVQIALTLVNQPLKSMENDGYPVNADLLMRAFKETFNSDSVSPEALWQSYSQLDQRSKNYARQRVIEENGLKSQQFVDSVKAANTDFKTTENGLGYIIKNAGTGEHPTPADTVLVFYKGMLTDGTVFDEHLTGEPARMMMRSVVKGFAEGLQLLGEGGEATLYIPGNLGYGDQGNPRAGIGPNAMIVFDVQLVKVLAKSPEE